MIVPLCCAWPCLTWIAMDLLFPQWVDVSESARAHPRVLSASRIPSDGVGGASAATMATRASDGKIPEGIPGAPVSAEMAMEGAQKLGRFVASTASMVGERATGAAGAAASGELTAADAGEAAAAAAQAAAGAAGEAAAAVSEKAKALGKLANDDSPVILSPHSTNEFIWDCCSSFRLLRSRPDTRHCY